MGFQFAVEGISDERDATCERERARARQRERCGERARERESDTERERARQRERGKERVLGAGRRFSLDHPPPPPLIPGPPHPLSRLETPTSASSNRTL